MKNIEDMTSYEIDEEIAHLERLRFRLTPEGAERLMKLKEKRDSLVSSEPK